MPERFRPCPECSYAVRFDAPHCPNCGLYLGPPPGLLDRVLGRVRPRRSAENLRALEQRLGEEIARLDGQVTHLEGARTAVLERVDEARREGRDPAPLREALRGLDEALGEARGLVLRLGRLVKGRGKGHSTNLYALSPEAREMYQRCTEAKNHEAGTSGVKTG